MSKKSGITYETDKEQDSDKIHVAMVLRLTAKKIRSGVRKRIQVYRRDNEALSLLFKDALLYVFCLFEVRHVIGCNNNVQYKANNNSLSYYSSTSITERRLSR